MTNPPDTPEGHGTIFIHGGQDASGNPLSDVWAFDVAARTWTPFPDAPGPGRSGACLAFAQKRLFRFSGFDGARLLEGGLDYLDLMVAKFDDQGGKGELCLSPLTGEWQSIASSADGPMPGPRSGAGLQAVTTGQGRSYLLLFLGERSPDSSGHERRGTFWDDIWSFQLKPRGMTAASFNDATKMILGKDTGEEQWARVRMVSEDDERGGAKIPQGCGWFACSTMDFDPAALVLWGGVGSNEDPIAYGWTLRLA